jgi:hypothetical protein
LRSLLVALAACNSVPPSQPPPRRIGGQPAAWQAFAVGPFSESRTGNIRASWAANRPKPSWVEATFADLGITQFDGTSLRGELSMWVGNGLDPRDCAAEVVWDDREHLGIRLSAPPELERARGALAHAVWYFRVDLNPSRPIVAAHAFVFCPVDAAHREPPWGVDFSTIDAVAAGRGAHELFCSELRRYPSPSVSTDIAGHHTFDLQFACGSLPRVRGRELVDECRGDVLLSLDDLGTNVIAGVPAVGAPLQDGELRSFIAGDTICSRMGLAAKPSFGAAAQTAFKAFVERAGPRLEIAGTRDGISQP